MSVKISILLLVLSLDLQGEDLSPTTNGLAAAIRKTAINTNGVVKGITINLVTTNEGWEVDGSTNLHDWYVKAACIPLYQTNYFVTNALPNEYLRWYTGWTTTNHP